jgi:hypothetical protein
MAGFLWWSLRCRFILVGARGSQWRTGRGRVDCFVQSTVRCTLLARWDEGYADAWLVLTDLAPEAADVVWYSMRSWIEGGFKDTKRGGWQWHQTKMTDHARASRLWLAIAVATLWVVSVGGEADATQPCSGLEALPALHVSRRQATKRSRPRLQSCFAQGCGGFSWRCWTDDDCRWDASSQSRGRRRCRLARNPRRNVCRNRFRRYHQRM